MSMFKKHSRPVSPFRQEPSPVSSSDDARLSAASSSRSLPKAIEVHSTPARNLSFEEEGQLLQSFDGVILTAVGLPLAINPENYHLLALLDDGRFILNRRTSLEEVIPMTQQRAARSGYAIKSRYTASGDFLRKLYDRFHKRSSESDVVVDEHDKTAGLSLFHRIVDDAARDRSSDIHIEVQSFGTVILFRVDGRLERQDLHVLSQSRGNNLVNAAFSACDEADGSVLEIDHFPKGQISGSDFALPPGVQSLRLQFLPLPTSESGALVVRLLYIESVGSYADVDRLGYAPFQLKLIHRARRRLSGLNLISGITGSGKSTTLEQTLTAIIRDTKGSRSVVTIEDPPEYVIPGAKQVPVTGSVEAREAGFMQAIRAVLRADPDIVMIGEVRDEVSANLALRAAKTGHQVWSTVHAISAVQALDRFVEEGVDEKRLFHPDVLSCLIAQRLVPVLCPSCSLPFDHLPDAESLRPETRFSQQLVRDIFKEHPQYLSHVRFRPSPDEYCADETANCREGYQGRTLVAEVVLCNRAFVHVCRSQDTIEAEDYWVEQMDGVRMVEHGVLKLIQGLFDPTDLNDAADLESFDPKRIPFLISKGSEYGFFSDFLDDQGEPLESEDSIDTSALLEG